LLHKKFNVKEKLGWNILDGYDNIKNNENLEEFIKQISYRPFDNRYIFYEDKLVWRTVRKVMQNFISGENLGIVTARSNKSDNCDHFYISKNIMETKCGERTTQSAIFPLYLYQEPTAFDERERIPNFNPKILAEIEAKLGMKLQDLPQGSPLSEGWRNSQNFDGVSNSDNQQPSTDNQFSPVHLLDYIYAVLHSPKYRETYKEFLKIDFPRVPFPDAVGTSRDLSTIQKNFWDLVQLGSEIRKLHLLEEIANKDLQTKYPIAGNNVVAKPTFVKEGSPLSEGWQNSKNFDGVLGKVFINETQYFENVPEIAWNFYIGGYQPAQKWLKDRKERELSYEDILHYQKIIYALTKTDELMKKIDDICFTEV